MPHRRAPPRPLPLLSLVELVRRVWKNIPTWPHPHWPTLSLSALVLENACVLFLFGTSAVLTALSGALQLHATLRLTPAASAACTTTLLDTLFPYWAAALLATLAGTTVRDLRTRTTAHVAAAALVALCVLARTLTYHLTAALAVALRTPACAHQ